MAESVQYFPPPGLLWFRNRASTQGVIAQFLSTRQQLEEDLHGLTLSELVRHIAAIS